MKKQITAIGIIITLVISMLPVMSLPRSMAEAYTRTISVNFGITPVGGKLYSSTSQISNYVVNVGSSGREVDFWEISVGGGSFQQNLGSINGDNLTLPTISGSAVTLYNKNTSNPGHMLTRSVDGKKWLTAATDPDSGIFSSYTFDGECLDGNGVSQCPGLIPLAAPSWLRDASGRAMTYSKNIIPPSSFYLNEADIAGAGPTVLASQIDTGTFEIIAAKSAAITRGVQVLQAGVGNTGKGSVKVSKTLNAAYSVDGVDYTIQPFTNPQGYNQLRNYKMDTSMFWQAKTYLMPSVQVRVTYVDTGEPAPPTIIGDFDILPSNTINWRDSFSLKPKNVVIPSGCTYSYHEYQISRDGTTWTSSKVYGQSTTSSYGFSSYPYVIGVGSHDITIKITANCADSGWISSKTLTINGPANNNPPDFQIGWTLPNQPTQIQTLVVVGTRLDLIYLASTVSDPDGDDIYWDGFDFSTSAAWAQTIPSNYAEYTDGYHGILMDTEGYFTVKATMRDQFGATTTKSVSISVVPPNPVAVITGSTEVVEGRTLATPLSSTSSYSPMNRTINHALDVWTNKKTTYTTVGTETVTLDVFDSSGLRSSQPDTHTITVKPDLPPVAVLKFIPTVLRGSQVVFTNASYSPDGDTIVSNTVSYRCDANNDGLYLEAAINVAMDANMQFTYTPTKVGACQFRVTVTENYGKQAISNFILTVTNENPEASFTLSGVNEEPTYTPPVSVTPTTLMGSTWTNTTMLDTSIAKRWVNNTTEGSIVATTDIERFSSISANTVYTYNFASSYYNSACSGNCAPNQREGNYVKYLGDGIIAGYNFYRDQVEFWDTSNTLIRSIKYLRLPVYDLKNDLAYGSVEDRSTYPYTYRYVSARISDLKNRNLSTVPYVLNVPVPAGSPPSINPYIPAGVEASTSTSSSEVSLALDVKRYSTATRSISSYHWGNYSPYKSEAFSNAYTSYYFPNASKDLTGNVFVYWQLPDNTWPQHMDLVKLNRITGQIDWKIYYPHGAYNGMKFFGDGQYLIQGTNSGGTKTIMMRDASNGQIIREKNITAPDYNYLGLLGIYNETILMAYGNSFHAYDYNLNLKWSTPTSNLPIKIGGISKDGYLLFVEKISDGYDTYHSYYKARLSVLNVNNGTTQSLNVFGPRFDNNAYFYVDKLEYIDDATLSLQYRHNYRYTDGSSGGTYHYATVIKTAPMVADTVLANEAYASGQLTSPVSLSNSDAEYYFDLRFNDETITKPAGFGFRIQNNKNMYRVEVFNNNVHLVKYVNGVRTVLKDVVYPAGKSSYISYKIKALGNNIRVYASGTPIIDMTDSQFTNGQFGPYSAMPKAEIKNVKYKILSSGGTSTSVNNVTLVDLDVQHTTTFTDLENDPQVNALTTWNYEHIAFNKFLNAGDGKSGLSAKHNQTVTSPFLNFDRVGTYRITYSAWDDPHPSFLYPSNTFASYRKKSDPYVEHVVVHRKPISNFTVSIKSDKTVGWVDYSYDPDRWLSASNYSTENTGINYQTTKGILEKKFYYLSPSGVSKSVQLVTPTESGIYTVGMAVKDEYGAWSDWMEQTVNVEIPVPADNPPTAGFTTTPSTVYRGTTITINSTATDGEDGARTNLPHQYYFRKDSDTEISQSTVRTSWTHAFTQIGTYTVRQVVSDSKGQTAQATRTVNVLNRKPSATITIPSSTNQTTPTQFSVVRPSFNWTFTDADSDAQARYQIKIYRYGGYLLLDSGVINSSLQTWTPSTDLPENQDMYAIVTVYDGFEWSVYSAAKFFYIQTNSPPVADFDWSPKPVWEGDTVTLTNQSSDPDGDSLTYSWSISGPGGYLQTAVTTHVSRKLIQPGDYTVTLTVSDGLTQTNLTRTLRAESLLLEANVSHTELWLEHHLQQGHETVLHPKSFYTGEIFVVTAVGSLAATSRVSASLDAIGRDGNPIEISVELTLVGQSNHFEANLYDSILSSLTGGLPEGQHQIKFKIEYTNGVVKEISIPIQIIGHVQGAVNVHRRQ